MSKNKQRYLSPGAGSECLQNAEGIYIVPSPQPEWRQHLLRDRDRDSDPKTKRNTAVWHFLFYFLSRLEPARCCPCALKYVSCHDIRN